MLHAVRDEPINFTKLCTCVLICAFIQWLIIAENELVVFSAVFVVIITSRAIIVAAATIVILDIIVLVIIGVLSIIVFGFVIVVLPIIVLVVIVFVIAVI